MTTLPRRFAEIPERGVLGHRGNPAHAPENTLVSFRQALDLGAHGLEFDVRLTGDGNLVVFHDAELLRTTGVPGLVRSHTLAELRGLDAGATFTPDGGRSFPWRERGVGINSLQDVLEALPGVPLLVEIKEEEAAPTVRRILEHANAHDRVLVGAFRHRTLAAFAGSRIARTCSTREVGWLWAAALAGVRFRRRPYAALSVPETYHGVPLPLAALARAVEAAEVPMYVWTVNEVEAARRCWARGVRAVLSDDPGPLLASRR
ncbi:MAG: hypothetical protein IT361_19125 [Gemmatimonadaceae bacterium]|nr:hypothetical protein [Gemmatimonadaceae bacterium]